MQPQPDDAPVSGASYLIPVDNVPALVQHASGLVRRARKAGVDCALHCRIEPRPQVLRDGDLLQWVTILVRPPRSAGWSLAARYDIDPYGMAATIPHAVPGVELPRRYWTLGDPVCEHCNTVARPPRRVPARARRRAPQDSSGAPASRRSSTIPIRSGSRRCSTRSSRTTSRPGTCTATRAPRTSAAATSTPPRNSPGPPPSSPATAGAPSRSPTPSTPPRRPASRSS